MYKFSGWFLALFFAGLLAGCGGGGSSTAKDTGTASFSIPLSGLTSGQATPQAVAAPSSSPITSVVVRLSRKHYTDTTQSLTVSGDVATGEVAGLAPGYWHVLAQVFNGSTLLYQGEADVKIVPGILVACTILFDSVASGKPSTGSVQITAGLNPLPGYTPIDQAVNEILHDETSQKLYMLDADQGVIGVYDANTLMRERDVTLAATPQAMIMDPSQHALLLGYATGKIYRLDLGSESFTLLSESLIAISRLTAINARYVLASDMSGWGPQNIHKTIDLATGEIVSTYDNSWYSFSHFTVNPLNGMVYALDSGLSPADIHAITINQTTGSIDDIVGSRYHGDYALGGPIRVIDAGQRLVTASGNMFISSDSAIDDLQFVGNLGHHYVDLASDPAANALYLLKGDAYSQKKLLVINQDTLFTQASVDIADDPEKVFNTPNRVLVFVTHNGKHYAKGICKNLLGVAGNFPCASPDHDDDDDKDHDDD